MMMKKINNKGFLFTILTFFLVLSVFTLASFFAMQKMPKEIYAEKTRNIFDDIKTDLEDLWQLSVSLERANDSLAISFQDHLPLANGTITLQRYETFIEGNFSDEISANVSLEGITNSTFDILPYNLVYQYSNFNKTEIRVYNKSGTDAVGILGYNITLDFDEYLEGMTNYSISGDLNVTLDATFANSRYNTTLSVNRSGNSTWIFELGDTNVTVKIGRNTINSLTKDSSLLVNLTGNSEVDITTRVILGYSNETVGVKTNIYLTIIDKIIREDYIWFMKG